MVELAELVLAMAPAELELFATQLPPEDLHLLEHVLAEQHALGWRADPASMAAHLDPKFRRWRYIALLAQAFVKAVTGDSPRLILSVPSRMGKTTLLRWGVVWGLDRRPDSRWIWAAYGDTLALESALDIRDKLRTHAGLLRVQLRRDRQRADRFVTEAGGGVLGAGINTSIIGFGAGDGGALIIDDPMKNWQEAHSQAARDRAWGQYTGTLRHRLDSEDTAIIVCHARWHIDDLTGRLVKGTEDETGEAWEHISLPSIAEAGRADPLGRAPGEVIEPEQFDLAAVRGRHLGMGSSYLVNALEQQNPSPPEGNELRREWFVLAGAAELPRQPEQAITSWDLKLKDREAGDYVVGQVWWRVAGGYWLMDQLRGQYDHATTANAIALLAVRHPEVGQHIVEAAGSHDDVLPQLRKPIAGYEVSDSMALRLGMSPAEREQVALLRQRGMARLIPHPPRGDKSVRARAYIAPLAEPGLVRINGEQAWVPALLDELAQFPDGQHDDQCLVGDALVLTPAGPVRLDTVTAGDVVLGRSGWVNVEAAGQTGTAIVHQRLTLSATAEHPVLTARGWVPFLDVRDDDTVLTCDARTATGKPSRPDCVGAATSAAGGSGRASRLARLPYPAARWTAASELVNTFEGCAPCTTGVGVSTATPSCPSRPNKGPSPSSPSSSPGSSSAATPTPRSQPIGGTTSRAGSGSSKASKPSTKRSGRRTTGRSLLGIMFTISTRTGLTTGSRTWPVSRKRSTLPSTPSSGQRQVEARSSSPTWSRFVGLLRRGTDHLRVGNGIASTRSEPPPLPGLLAVPVFNLRTSDGTYFANSVLVHNCDAMSQALQRLAVGQASATAASGTVVQARPGAHRAGGPVPSPPAAGRASAASPRGQLPRRRLPGG